MTTQDITERYGPIIARCRSSRDASKVYEVRRHPESRAYACNCPGWANRKACKHTKAAELTEGRSGIVDMKVNGRAVVKQALNDDRIKNALGAAIKKEAARIAEEARGRRPILMVKPIELKAAEDAIEVAAREAAAKILMWGRNGIRVDDAAEVIEAAIRRFAGSAPDGAGLLPALAAERGVREIILED